VSKTDKIAWFCSVQLVLIEPRDSPAIFNKFNNLARQREAETRRPYIEAQWAVPETAAVFCIRQTHCSAQYGSRFRPHSRAMKKRWRLGQQAAIASCPQLQCLQV